MIFRIMALWPDDVNRVRSHVAVENSQFGVILRQRDHRFHVGLMLQGQNI